MDGDTQQKIMYDVAGNVPVSESKIVYDDEMLEFRDKVEAEWSEWREDHPDAELAVPSELPGEPNDDTIAGDTRRAVVDHHEKMAKMHQAKTNPRLAKFDKIKKT